MYELLALTPVLAAERHTFPRCDPSHRKADI